MAFSYSGNPAASVKDAVRFEAQDTNPNAPLLTDEEVLYSVSVEAPGTPPSQGEVLSAAAHCMEALARRFSSVADVSTGSRKTTSTKRAQAYTERAKEIRARAQGMHSPYSIQQTSEKEALENETGRIQPLFRREEFNIPQIPGVPLGSQEQERG